MHRCCGGRWRAPPDGCANPDLVVMHGNRLALCAGALAQWYEEAGGRVRWHGKPFRSVYDTCLELLGIEDRTRILAVGDSLRTDIAGATGAGLDSVLIADGIHAEEFGTTGNQPPDLERIAAALQSGSYSPWAWRAAFAGEGRPRASVAAPDMQDRVAQAGVVAEPERGQHGSNPEASVSALLRSSACPYRRIAQPGGIARATRASPR